MQGSVSFEKWPRRARIAQAGLERAGGSRRGRHSGRDRDAKQGSRLAGIRDRAVDAEIDEGQT